MFFRSSVWVQTLFLESDNHTRMFESVCAAVIWTQELYFHSSFLLRVNRKAEGVCRLCTCSCAFRAASQSTN